MKKILLTLFGLMLMFSGNVMAQEPEVTIDLTTNDGWGFPTDYVRTGASYTKDGVTLTFSESSNGHKFNEKDQYVIFGKKDAVITFSAFSFDVERIDFIGREGASAATLQNIFVGDEAVSTETTGATGTNKYVIAADKQAAGTIYALKVLSNHNTQITKILVWKKGTTQNEEPTPDPTIEEVSVAKALEIIDALGEGKTTAEEYMVKGFIVGAPDFQRKDNNELYGNVNFTMADEKGGTALLTVFRAKDFGNVPFTEETINRLKEGDEVVLQGKLQKYVKNGEIIPELSYCYLISVNGETTNIREAKAAEKDAPIFNVSGQLLSAPQKGINIIGGRKVFVK